MILPDDKRAPPPPYPSAVPLRRSWNRPKLSDLSPSILLRTVEATFPPYIPLECLEGHRRNLYWLTMSLRLVNRGFYIACMHTLRSTYIQPYLSMINPPYSSDPFPLGSTEASGSAESPTSPPIPTLQRETEALDLFIALKSREDVLFDETDLHLGREESFNDLFALTQPRRRTEDLLRYYGVRYGYITLPDSPSASKTAIPFSQLTISFSARKVGIVLLTPASKSGSRRIPQSRTTILECERARNEKLEVVAKKLAKALGSWIDDRK